ncbi:MAG: ABC transporter substrate-binding protein, partial [Acidimicrobiales bacterium]
TPYVRKLSFVSPGSDSVLALTSKIVDAGGIGTEEIITTAAFNQVASYPRVSTAGGFNRVMQFNLTKGFPYNNVKFRQAVAYTVDRKDILSTVLGGRGVVPSFGTLNPTHPMVATGLPGYDLGTHAANVVKAKALLAEIGFTDNVPSGGDGKLELPDTSANWSPVLYQGVVSSASSTVPTIVQQNLLDAGLKFGLTPDTSQPNADSRATNGNYEMMMVNWGNNTSDADQLRTRLSDPVTAANRCFSCIFGWNAANGSPGATEFQTLADQQLIEPSATLRKQQIQRMQVLVAADVLQFALYIPDQLLFYQPGSFSAWYATPGGTPPGPPSYSNKHVFVTGKQFGLPAGF